MNGFFDKEKRELICVTRKQEIYDLLNRVYNWVWVCLVEAYKYADVLVDTRGQGSLQFEFDLARLIAEERLLTET